MELNKTESDFRLLPKFLISKRAILNPKNMDHRSFGYAIMFSLHPNDWKYYASSPQKDSHFEQLGLNNIKYPVLIDEIPSCEEKLNIRINVFTFDDAAGYKRHSLYISKKFKKEEANLLFWDGRFAFIKYFSRLFSDVKKYFTFYFNG
jgi:hypothetical protein